MDKLYKTLDTAFTLLFPNFDEENKHIILNEVDLPLLSEYLKANKKHTYDCKTVCDEDDDFYSTGKKLFKKKGVMLFFESVDKVDCDMTKMYSRELWLLDDMSFVIALKKINIFHANDMRYSVYLNEVVGDLSEEHGFALSPIDFGMLLISFCFEQDCNEPIGALLHLEGAVRLKHLLN